MRRRRASGEEAKPQPVAYESVPSILCEGMVEATCMPQNGDRYCRRHEIVDQQVVESMEAAEERAP